MEYCAKRKYSQHVPCVFRIAGDANVTHASRMDLGKSIKHFIEARGTTQAQVCRDVARLEGDLELSEPNLSKYANNIHVPSTETLDAIAKVLNIKVYDLFIVAEHPDDPKRADWALLYERLSAAQVDHVFGLFNYQVINGNAGSP